AFFRSLDQRTDGQTQLIVVDATGRNAVFPRTPPLEQLPWAAVWAPDSRTIAMITKQQLDGVVAMVDTSGVDEPELVDTGDIHPDGIAVRPTSGDRMLFRGNLGRDIGLFESRPDGSDLRTLIAPFDTLSAADTAWPSDHAIVA